MKIGRLDIKAKRESNSSLKETLNIVFKYRFLKLAEFMLEYNSKGFTFIFLDQGLQK